MGLMGGLLGAAAMWKGNKMMSGVANSMPGQEELEMPWKQSQGLIDRMTNFGQYSGQAMDLASQEGNQGVENSMMMGMGGSQANAIKNRMKRSAMGDVYGQYNKGLANAGQMQQRMDSDISGQMQNDRQDQRQIRMGQAGSMMGIGQGIMGGSKGMANILNSIPGFGG